MDAYIIIGQWTSKQQRSCSCFWIFSRCTCFCPAAIDRVYIQVILAAQPRPRQVLSLVTILQYLGWAAGDPTLCFIAWAGGVMISHRETQMRLADGRSRGLANACWLMQVMADMMLMIVLIMLILTYTYCWYSHVPKTDCFIITSPIITLSLQVCETCQTKVTNRCTILRSTL